MSAVSPGRVIAASLIFTGNMVGVGILALPINLGPTGLIPAIVASVGMWLLMLYTGLSIARQPFFAENPDADMATFYETTLGTLGKYVTVVANLVLFWGLLVAYLTGAASIIVDTFKLDIPNWAAMLGYFAVGALLTSFGERVMRHCNALLMAVMVGSFIALVFLVIPHTDTATDMAMDWPFMPATLPILIAGLCFHNVIPVVSRALRHDYKAVRKAVLFGSGLGMVMTLSWTVVVIMALPVTGDANVSIMGAFKENLPATVPLERLLNSSVFTNTALAFSIVAITTSFTAVGIGIQSFLRDLFSSTRLSGQLPAWLGAFLPPVLVSVFFPEIFLKALNLVGGVGIGTLFGILPGIVLIRKAGASPAARLTGWLLVATFGAILCLDVLQEAGVLHIDPDVEYWSHVLRK